MYVLFYYVRYRNLWDNVASNKVAIPCLFDTHVHILCYLLVFHSSNSQFILQHMSPNWQQYPLPEAVGVVKDIFKRLHVLANEIPEDKRDTFFKPLLPALTKFCQTFPPLCTDTTELLLHLGKLCLVSESNLLSQPDKNLQTIKENLACQVLDASYILLVKWAIMILGCRPSEVMWPNYMVLEDQLDGMDGVLLIEGLQKVFKDIVNTLLLRVATKMWTRQYCHFIIGVSGHHNNFTRDLLYIECNFLLSLHV